MDIDLLKSSTEDQMDLMIMMEMEKLPEFSACDSFPGNGVAPELPVIRYPSGDNCLIFSGNCNMSESSPSLLNPCSSMPISGHIKDTGCSPTAPFSDSMTGKPRNLADGSCGITVSSKRNSMATMREMIFRIAAMQPIHIDPESVKPPKRRNVKISKDPQSVAARHRRERISERIRILQRLVPGGTKMDTASMLDEAIHYVKFLKTQVQSLERAAANRTNSSSAASSVSRFGFPAVSQVNFSSFPKPYQSSQMFSPSQLLS